MLGAAVAILAFCATALPARASVIAGAITSLTTTSTNTQQYDRVDLACTWAVPDGSSPGDTFTMQLPAELRWFGSSTFALKAPTGEVVATAQAGPTGLVTFTLSDYVLTHPVDVHGDCTFSTQYMLVGTGQDVTVQFAVGSEVIPVVIGTGAPCTQNCLPTHTQAFKNTWWTDGTQQRAQSRIEAPPTTTAVTTVTLTDTPQAGMALDCSTVVPRIGRSLGADGLVLQPGDDALYPPQVACSPTHLSVTWVGVPAGEYTEVGVESTITDPTLSRYTNTGVVTLNGVDLPVESVLARTDGGGTGAGGTATPTPTTTAPTTTAPTTTTPTTTTPTTTTPTTTTPTTTTPSTTTPSTAETTAAAAPSPTPAVQSTSAAAPEVTGSALAFTGANSWPLMLDALVLLGLGGVALVLRVLVVRGRSSDTTP